MGKNKSGQDGYGAAAKRAAQLGWFALTGLTLLIITVHLPLLLDTVGRVCSGTGCDEMQLASEVAADLGEIGMSLGTYAWIRVTTVAVIELGWAVTGVILFARKSDQWIGILASIVLVTFGPAIIAGKDIAALHPFLHLPAGIFETLSVVLLFTLFFVFPNGRLEPRWVRWLWSIILLYGVANSVRIAFLQVDPPYNTTDFTPPAAILGFLLIGILAQIYRYVRISTPVERQQTKWVVHGFMGVGMVGSLFLLGTVLFPIESVQPLYYRFAAMAVGTVLTLAFPLSIVFSILRYGLWDIDKLINRTLVYGAVTTILVFTYFGSVVLMQNTFRALTGQNSQLAIVISTLTIAALFNPLRRRVQNFIDRRFYRSKYDAEQTLARFSAAARDEVDMDRLTAALLKVIEETMRPEQVSLWLREPSK